MEENYILFALWEWPTQEEIIYDTEERGDNCNVNVLKEVNCSEFSQAETWWITWEEKNIIEIRIYTYVGDTEERKVFKGHL